jgi:hypothetical protein
LALTPPPGRGTPHETDETDHPKRRTSEQMPDPVPTFQQLNLVVRDMDAAVAFYGTLGLPIRGGDAGD